MPENDDPKAPAAMPPGGGGAGLSESGSRDPGPDPIFVSFIYDFAQTETGTALSGGGTGRPGTIGGPINEQKPMFRVYTYPFIPVRGEDIGTS